MYDRERVELFLLGREDGMTVREAAELAGVSPATGRRWGSGSLPHSCTGARRRGAMASRTRREEEPVDESERAAYEAAILENQLLRAVLADLKAGGWAPASISSGRRAEPGGRSRRATGLPLRETARFLGISKSSYEYQRARAGLDREAAIRPLVVEAFEASGGAYGYRRLHAGLAARGVRVSGKRVRRVMREEGLEARSTARSPHRYSSHAGEDGRGVAPNLPLGEGKRSWRRASPRRHHLPRHRTQKSD